GGPGVERRPDGSRRTARQRGAAAGGRGRDPGGGDVAGRGMNATFAQLSQWDRDHVWHPFTAVPAGGAEPPLFIERAEGCYLIDTEGRRYIDGVSSMWCNVHGHRVAELDAAVREQLDRVAHSTLLGLANVPATLLARRLVELAPP